MITTEVIKDFHKEIREITSELTKLNIPKNFVETTKKIALQFRKGKIDGDIFKEDFFCNIGKTYTMFFYENKELVHRMQTLNNRYWQVGLPVIYSGIDDSGKITEDSEPVLIDGKKYALKYNPAEVDPISLWFLMAYSEGELSSSIFENPSEFSTCLRNMSQPELAEHVESNDLDTLYDLIDLF